MVLLLSFNSCSDLNSYADLLIVVGPIVDQGTARNGDFIVERTPEGSLTVTSGRRCFVRNREYPITGDN